MLLTEILFYEPPRCFYRLVVSIITLTGQWSTLWIWLFSLSLWSIPMLAMVLWTSAEGHPFAWVAYLWVWGVSSFNLTLGLKEGTLGTLSIPLLLLLSLSSWAFWRSCNCLWFMTLSGLTPLTGLIWYTFGPSTRPNYPLGWTVLFLQFWEHSILHFFNALQCMLICSSWTQIHLSHSHSDPANYHMVFGPCVQTSIDMAAIQ